MIGNKSLLQIHVKFRIERTMTPTHKFLGNHTSGQQNSPWHGRQTPPRGHSSSSAAQTSEKSPTDWIAFSKSIERFFWKQYRSHASGQPCKKLDTGSQAVTSSAAPRQWVKNSSPRVGFCRWSRIRSITRTASRYPLGSDRLKIRGYDSPRSGSHRQAFNFSR